MSGERVSSLSSSDPAPAPTARQPPVDLRLVAVTPDRSFLVLEDSHSQQFRVPVDERLAAALRAAPRDRARPGQLEIALESQLTPREIQTRIRSGHSVDEVALAAGISPERVDRYASPVIAERGHVVEQAQRAPGRRATGGSAPALLDLVHARLAEQRAADDTVQWDAVRADDTERWTVRLTYLAGGRSRTASWTFDPRGRVLSPADDEARWLVDDTGQERDEEAPPAAVRRLASVPATEPAADRADPVAAAASDEVYDREADEAVAAPTRSSVAARAARRPAVPSFDDIMFGPRKRD